MQLIYCRDYDKMLLYHKVFCDAMIYILVMTIFTKYFKVEDEGKSA